MESERIVVAEILRSRGNKGELLARSQTDVPHRLSALRRAQVHLPNGSDLPIEIETAWEYRGDWVFKLAGVDSISEADRYAGADIWIPAQERGTLPQGEYFQSDLIGCSLIGRETGEQVGVVSGWQHYGASPLLEVEVGDRVALVPFVPAICQQVDLASRTIVVELPEGLLDL